MIFFIQFYLFLVLTSRIFCSIPNEHLIRLAVNLLHEQENTSKLMKFKFNAENPYSNPIMFENKLRKAFYDGQREFENNLEKKRREEIYKKYLINRITGSFSNDFHSMRY
jgi:hypothetical protein